MKNRNHAVSRKDVSERRAQESGRRMEECFGTVVRTSASD